MGEFLGPVPVKGKEGSRIEQREEAGCDAGQAASDDLTWSSGLDWCPELWVKMARPLYPMTLPQQSLDMPILGRTWSWARWLSAAEEILEGAGSWGLSSWSLAARTLLKRNVDGPSPYPPYPMSLPSWCMVALGFLCAKQCYVYIYIFYCLSISTKAQIVK